MDAAERADEACSYEGSRSTTVTPGSSATVTYLGALNGNAGTPSDKAGRWATVMSQAISSGDTPQLAQNAVTIVLD